MNQEQAAELGLVCKRLIRRKEVERITGMRTSTIYEQMAKGVFPKPVKIGIKMVAWVQAEVDAWVDERINRRGQQ